MLAAILCFACFDPSLAQSKLHAASLPIVSSVAVTFSGHLLAPPSDGRIDIPQDVMADKGTEPQLPLSLTHLAPMSRRLPLLDIDDRMPYRPRDLGLYLFPWQSMSHYANGR